MDKLLVTGGQSLQGTIEVSGAKNAALPIMTACLLTEKPVTIANVPHLHDVVATAALLRSLGVDIGVIKDKVIEVKANSIANFYAPYDLVRTMRASILVLGPLLSKYGRAKVSMPGGCAIGTRPVDLHIESLKAMGAQINIINGYIDAKVSGRLHGAEIDFPKVTVTGTANIVMAATLADGTTVIHNAAKEPEIIDLCDFLNTLGAKISGAGTDTISIEGVKQLTGGYYSILPDRIEAATYLVAATMTKGKLRLEQACPWHITAVIDVLKAAGASITTGDNWIEITMNKRPLAVDINTAPYPGFPTDMQAQLMAMNTIALGKSVIQENIFENRFMHVQELSRLGAKLQIDGNTVICEGVEKLHAAPVMATDLRASASLVLAGLVANGTTDISRIYHIDRGYEAIEDKLSALGAKTSRVSEQL